MRQVKAATLLTAVVLIAPIPAAFVWPGLELVRLLVPLAPLCFWLGYGMGRMTEDYGRMLDG